MAIGDGTNVVREFNLQEFCYKFHHFPVQAHSALQLLDKTGIIQYTEDEEITSRLMFTLNRDELYQLRQRPEKQERIIHALLRNYSGIFVELVYIDEYALAQETGVEYNDVYLYLKEMAHDGIVNYIPRKRTNYITFLSRRVDKDEIILPDYVYADRRKQYEQRILTMIQYVTDRDLCHSRFLLSYFGEKNTKKCGRCDICIDKKKTTENEHEAIRAHFLRQLQLGPLSPRDVDYAGFDRDIYISVVQEMCHREEILLDNAQCFILP